ncbi:hypothetical protein BsWGS_24837 [Bradybaena similaris]
MIAAYLFLFFAVPLITVAVQPARVSREAEDSLCPPDWVQFGDSCYSFVREKVGWPEAVSLCREFGGYLLEVNSKDENDWVVSQIRERKFTYSWLGASDMLKEGTFRWMTNNELVGNAPYFGSDQPNNLAAGEQCLAMDGLYYDYKWVDDECEYIKTFVCEKSTKRYGTNCINRPK